MKKILLMLILSVSLSLATTVTFNGVEVTLNSNGLKVGDEAPVFNATTINFEDTTVGGKKDKIQIIAFVPSFNTTVCQLEVIEFNRKVSKMENVLLTIVSKDLPFTQLKFCRDNSIKNIETVSDYKDANNAKRYGATVSAPVFLEGIFGRVVYIVDTEGNIAYVEVVKDMTLQPNYNAIIKALEKIN